MSATLTLSPQSHNETRKETETETAWQQWQVANRMQCGQVPNRMVTRRGCCEMRELPADVLPTHSAPRVPLREWVGARCNVSRRCPRKERAWRWHGIDNPSGPDSQIEPRRTRQNGGDGKEQRISKPVWVSGPEADPSDMHAPSTRKPTRHPSH